MNWISPSQVFAKWLSYVGIGSSAADARAALQVRKSDDAAYTNARTPVAHTHVTGNIDGLDTALAARAALVSQSQTVGMLQLNLFDGINDVYHGLSAGDYELLFNPEGGGSQAVAMVPYVIDNFAPKVNQSELVTNGSFASGATGWTLGTGWSVSGGVASCNTAGTFGDIRQTINALEFGASYVVELTITSFTSGAVAVYMGSSGSNFSIVQQASTSQLTAVGTYSFLHHFCKVNGSKVILIRANPSFVGSIDNVSVKRAF